VFGEPNNVNDILLKKIFLLCLLSTAYRSALVFR